MSTAWLQVQNNSHDVLAADVLAGDATIEVTTAATQFPAAYPYRVTVWDAATHIDPGDDPNMEIMQVTSRAGNVLSVTRAQEGTAAAAHTTGDVVRLLVTAGMVDQIHDTIDAHDHSATGDGAQIDHVELASIGSNTHAQIDTHLGAANPHSGSASTGDLAAHVGDTGNPHAVTTSQIGAASAGDLSAHVGDVANPHAVTAEQTGAASTGDLAAHVGDTGNPHAVSAAQTGAATTGDLSAHTGAANPHTGSASTGDLATHVGNVANPHAVTASQTGAASAGDLSTHIGNVANPHSVTAAQVGAATTGDLSAHVGNVSNPHAVTASQTGAATTGDLSSHVGDTGNPHVVTIAQIGAAAASDLSSHVGNTSNPHAVSAAQVGNSTAQWNANKLQGTTVDAAAIGTGKVLKYDGTKLVYAADNNTTYTAGTGLTLAGTQFSANPSAIDHGALGGLDGDDHTQYHTDGRALTWLGTRSTTDLPEGTGLYHTTARARAAVSATTPLGYDSNTGIFSIQQASAAQAGYLSAADWTTFNAKQAALTLPLTHENGGLEADVSAYAGLLKISGGVTSAVTDNSAAWDAAAGLAHAAVTVADTGSVDLTLTGQQVSAAVLPAGVDHNALLNYSADRHFLQTSIDHVSTGLATGLLKVTTGTGALSVAVASDLPTHATRHESGGGDQVNHDSLTGFVADEHIDWTNASNNLLTSGTGQVARMGVGCAPTTGTTQCVQETFTTPDADGNGIDVLAVLAPSGALGATTRTRALRFDARWNSAVDGSTYGVVYGIEGLAQILTTASGNLFRASGVRAGVVHYGSGNVAKADVVYSLLDNNDEANETGDITEGYNYLAACATDKGTGVIGTRYGYAVEDITGGGACTTQYGLHIASLTGATTNRAVWLAGTGSSNGIWMGEDVVLYRGSANVLKTDDALHIAGSGIAFPAGTATINGSGGWLKVESGTTLYLQYDNPTKAVQVGKSGNNLTATVFGGLTLTSTTQPFIPPRMTTTQRDAIASPIAGMVVYNSTTNVLNFYNGSGWGAV